MLTGCANLHFTNNHTFDLDKYYDRGIAEGSCAARHFEPRRDGELRTMIMLNDEERKTYMDGYKTGYDNPELYNRLFRIGGDN